jgi:murein DD-endopeptidase MepM/ murein hydrolase activator NlpD
LQQGSVVVLRNTTLGQPLNLRQIANGGKINGSPANAPLDADQKLSIRRKPGTNIIQIYVGNKVVSVKDNPVSGSMLEVWDKVGDFSPYQSFFVDTLPNGNIVLVPVINTKVVVNLKYGGTKEPYAPYMLWERSNQNNDTDMQFKVEVLDIKPSQYANPVPGSTITQLAGGPESHANYSGVDFGTGNSTPPAYAVYGGTVIQSAFTNDGGGNTVMVRSDNGEIQFYWHLSRRDVVANQRIQQGQQIGLVGRTGNSTGNHLHIEFRTSNSGTRNWDRARDFQNFFGLRVGKRM